MECKAYPTLFVFAGIVVLIETLWNVKSATTSVSKSIVFVLIETLWNVKTADGRTERWGIAGFNRNIVECKGH